MRIQNSTGAPMQARLQAHALGHRYVGTEHLLLSLIKEDQGGASNALTHLGVTYSALREQIVHALREPLLRDGQDPEGPPEHASAARNSSRFQAALRGLPRLPARYARSGTVASVHTPPADRPERVTEPSPIGVAPTRGPPPVPWALAR